MASQLCSTSREEGHFHMSEITLPSPRKIANNPAKPSSSVKGRRDGQEKEAVMASCKTAIVEMKSGSDSKGKQDNVTVEGFGSKQVRGENNKKEEAAASKPVEEKAKKRKHAIEEQEQEQEQEKMKKKKKNKNRKKAAEVDEDNTNKKPVQEDEGAKEEEEKKRRKPEDETEDQRKSEEEKNFGLNNRQEEEEKRYSVQDVELGDEGEEGVRKLSKVLTVQQKEALNLLVEKNTIFMNNFRIKTRNRNPGHD
ncbi:hypothetical protein KI387_031655 [Taxus chinensis]|uniref:Uncharacterized protein n=1 Tax=Taxus chinensis TaxID=29808 RepID=A0AA38C0V0_TAXCH|nr:hypothetical protein KI387_031655 [Taxus chinensis]